MDHGKEEDEIEIPNYFICPISLEIMKDPVTTVSGITYDRQSIVKWLEKVPSCPVTKQPLPLVSDLTPYHMLRRLIQHWCVENATGSVVRISTPRVLSGKPKSRFIHDTSWVSQAHFILKRKNASQRMRRLSKNRSAATIH